MRSTQQVDSYCEDRFPESWAGSIITNPSMAIVELGSPLQYPG
jgi:hypothetical protein